MEIEKQNSPSQNTIDTKERSSGVINDHVDGNITQLTLSALSSALGDIRVMKLTVTGKSSAKYVAVTDPEEIVQALNYIAKFSNYVITPAALKEAEQGYSYFILQQSPISMSAWNSLVDRRLGKIPQEAKIEASVQYDLVQAGIEAQKRSAAGPTYEVLPSVPKIHTTNP